MVLRLKRVLLLGVMLVLLGAGYGGGGKLGAKALSQESKSMQSVAAGAVLADDCLLRKDDAVYAREHCSGNVDWLEQTSRAFTTGAA